jgi:hypothetical protein
VNPGPVCLQLSQVLLEIQRSIAEDSWAWRWEVTDPDAVLNRELQVKEVRGVNGERPNGGKVNGLIEGSRPRKSRDCTSPCSLKNNVFVT